MTPSPAPLEFWFDFASGYVYFAALEVDALAARHGRSVLWRPFSLGSSFKVTGARGLSSTPLKSDYAARDWQRLARLKGVAFAPPADHPHIGLPALRAFYTVREQDEGLAARFGRAVITGYFSGQVSLNEPAPLAALAARLGGDEAAVMRGMGDQRIKDMAKAQGDEAVRRGVFGSPWIFVDGEPFWGADRLAMVEDWLAKGPW